MDVDLTEEGSVSAPPSAVQGNGTLRPLLWLVWPVLIEQLLVMMVGFSDFYLAGHYLSESHIAAMTIINYLLWMFPNLFAIVSIGAVAMTARFVGAGDWKMANRVTNQSLVLGGILAAVFTTLAVILGPYLPGLLRLEGEPARLAAQYLQIAIPMIPGMMLEAVSIGCLRGAGDMKTGLVTMALVNVVNLAVAWTLVLALGPDRGWIGLPIGAACGYAIGGLLPFSMLLRGRFGLKVRRDMLRPDTDLMRRVLRIGIPGGTDILLITVCQLLYVSFVAHLGKLATAAHGVALRIESLAFLPGFAFQVATATLVGQYLGAKDHRRAQRSVLLASTISGGISLVAGLAMFVDPQRLVQLVVGAGQDEVLETAAPLLHTVAIAMVPLGIMQVLSGALRGAGDTRVPLFITLFGFVGVRLPIVYLTTQYWEIGVIGAWYAMVADILVRAGLVSLRFVHGGWKKIEV